MWPRLRRRALRLEKKRENSHVRAAKLEFRATEVCFFMDFSWILNDFEGFKGRSPHTLAMRGIPWGA